MTGLKQFDLTGRTALITGSSQGIGFALMEEMQFDPDTGACLTGNFLDYKIPTALEMPRRNADLCCDQGPAFAAGLFRSWPTGSQRKS